MKVRFIYFLFFVVVAFRLGAAEIGAEVESALKKAGELAPEETLAKTMEMDETRAKELGASKERIAELLTLAQRTKAKSLSHLGQKLTVEHKKSPTKKINFFEPNSGSSELHMVTDPRQNKSVTFSPVDIDMIRRHGYYPQCCKPDRVLVVFENPYSVQAAKQADERSKPREKIIRTPIEPPAGPFSIGGVNRSETIGGLLELGGIAISVIESRMRKPDSGGRRWLGETESLIDVLKADNDLVLKELAGTHQLMATPLETLSSRAKPGKALQMKYKEAQYRVTIKNAAPVVSAFGAEEADSRWVTIQSVATGKKITYPKLAEYWIWRYGFYGSAKASFRLDPKKIVGLFPSLEK